MSPFDLSAFRSADAVVPGATVEVLSTGSFLFDYITGIGGLPRGRIVEAFGPQSSGKSTAFYQAGVEAQRKGGSVLLLDHENSYTQSYAEQLGLDVSPSKLLVEQPFDLETGFAKALEVTRKYAESNSPEPLLVIFDSIAAMRLKDEDPTNNMAAAVRAKAIYNYLRDAVGIVARSGAIWAFINHERDNIFTGAPWEINQQKAAKGATSTPGGNGPKFFSSQRYQFAVGAKLKGDVLDPITGEMAPGNVAVKVRVTAVKNKLAAPFRQAEMLIRFGAGIDPVFSVLDVGVKRGLIGKESKLTFVFPDGGKTTSGAQGALEYLATRPVLVMEIETQLRSVIEAAWEQERERLLTSAAAIATATEEKEETANAD